jgi:SAM-dependent methyltransferase
MRQRHQPTRDEVAAIWERSELARPPEVREHSDFNFAHVVRFAPDEKGAAILDVGCGNGRHLVGLSKRGYSRLFGVDLFQTLPHPIFEYKSGSIDALPFADSTFDYLYSCGSVVSHVSPPAIWACEFARVLKPGGRCMVTAHTLYSTHTAIRRVLRALGHRSVEHTQAMHFESADQIRDALKSAGLTEHFVGGFRPSIIWLWRPGYNYLLRPLVSKLGLRAPFAMPKVTENPALRRILSVIGYHAVFVYEKPSISVRRSIDTGKNASGLTET